MCPIAYSQSIWNDKEIFGLQDSKAHFKSNIQARLEEWSRITVISPNELNFFFSGGYRVWPPTGDLWRVETA